MSKAKVSRILHGDFGRAMLMQLDRSISVHAHRTCQILFQIDGPEIDVTVQDRHHRLVGQGVVMVNAWEPHSYEYAEGQTSAGVLSLYIEPAWLKRIDRWFEHSMHPRFFSVPFGNVPAAAQHLVDGLVDLIAYEPDPTPHDVETLILNIVLALTAEYSDWTGLRNFETMGGVACDARIRKIMSIMRDTVGEPIVVEDLARLVRMSRPHFFHMFKQETHLTPIVYSSMLRMDMAIKMITETVDSLLDISLRLGFESPGNFTRFFAMQQGIPPSQYRRSVTVLSPTVPPPNVFRGDPTRVEKVGVYAEARSC